MPDCHTPPDSSTFHTVNPGEKTERQSEGAREGTERLQKQEGATKTETRGEDGGVRFNNEEEGIQMKDE